MALRHPYRRGDVLLVEFPFSSGIGKKARPAIVLSTDLFHQDWDEIITVGITSRRPRRLRNSDVAISDWQAAGLSQPSFVRSHFATIHHSRVLSRLGSLSQADRQAIEDCVRGAAAL
jgi:mRNA interferase MazF